MKTKKNRKLITFLCVLLLLIPSFLVFVKINSVFATQAWYLTGFGDDYCMYYDDGPASRWGQSWVGSALSTYEAKSIRLGFHFDDASAEGNSGSVYDQTKMSDVLDYLDAWGVSGILLLQNNGESCEGYCGSWDWYYQWLNVTTDFYGDNRIAAFSIFGEPAHESGGYDTWATSGPVGAITTRYKLQEAFAYLIDAIHNIDPDRVVIYPLGSFSYTNVGDWASDISSVGMLNEPNVIFDVVHPYFFENEWDMGLNPTQKAGWYESNWVAPSVSAFSASKCYCGETFCWGGKTHTYQVTFLTEMINVFVDYQVGFTVWAYFSSDASWDNEAIVASDYLGSQPPEEPPEEPPEGSSNITRVQGPARGTTTSSSISVSMTSTPTEGNLLIATVGLAYYEWESVSSITQTNVVWTRQVYNQYASVYVAVWTGVVSASAGKDITITLSGAPDYGGVADVCEYSGLLTSGFLDVAATAQSDSGTSSSTGTTSTTSQDDELWVGATVFGGDISQSTPTNSFTLLDGENYGSALSIAFLEKIVDSAGTANSGTTGSGSGNWIGCVATFKASYTQGDTTSPTYSDISISSMVADTSCNFNVTINDDTALETDGQYQFGTNNTGTWVWESAVNFTSTPQAISVTKTLNETVGSTIAYCWNFTDNSGNFNTTGIQSFGIPDSENPTFSDVSYSITAAGTSCMFNATFDDDTQLGFYIFSTNNTGVWANNTAIEFSSTPQTVSVSKTLNTTVGVNVGFIWYVNDTYNNWNSTEAEYLETTDETAPTYSSYSYSTDIAGISCNLNVTVSDGSGLSYYIFSTQNTGTWTNETVIAFSTNPQSISKTITLNSTVGIPILWKWYANDTLGLWSVSDEHGFLTVDGEPPTFGSILGNTTVAAAAVIYTCTISDNVEVSGYIASWNNTGTWTNGTFSSGTSGVLSGTNNSTIGVSIGVKFYAKDTSNQWSVSEISYFVTTDGGAPTFGVIVGTTTVVDVSVIYTCTISDTVSVSGYIASWNNTGVWTNGTWTSGSIGTLSGIHNETVGNVVSVRFYANDTTDNWGASSQYNFVLTSAEIPSDGLPTVEVDNMWQFLYEGNWIGLATSLLLSVFGDMNILVAVLSMLFFIPLYIRTKSLMLLCIIWVLLGPFLIVAMPAVSEIAILFTALGIGGLLWRLFRPTND